MFFIIYDVDYMKNKPQVSIVMGSQSDWPTMENSANILKQLSVAYETKIVSAHRTPDRMYEFAKSAKQNDIKVIIAGAGGAAHLPGMIASLTHIPVLGVPVKSKNLNGLDSLYSIVQMPSGIPVATFAIGDAGAKNAALYAASILALSDDEIEKNLLLYRKNQSESIKLEPVTNNE